MRTNTCALIVTAAMWLFSWPFAAIAATEVTLPPGLATELAELGTELQRYISYWDARLPPSDEPTTPAVLMELDELLNEIEAAAESGTSQNPPTLIRREEYNCLADSVARRFPRYVDTSTAMSRDGADQLVSAADRATRMMEYREAVVTSVAKELAELVTLHQSIKTPWQPKAQIPWLKGALGEALAEWQKDIAKNVPDTSTQGLHPAEVSFLLSDRRRREASLRRALEPLLPWIDMQGDHDIYYPQGSGLGEPLGFWDELKDLEVHGCYKPSTSEQHLLKECSTLRSPEDRRWATCRDPFIRKQEIQRATLRIFFEHELSHANVQSSLTGNGDRARAIQLAELLGSLSPESRRWLGVNLGEYRAVRKREHKRNATATKVDDLEVLLKAQKSQAVTATTCGDFWDEDAPLGSRIALQPECTGWAEREEHRLNSERELVETLAEGAHDHYERAKHALVRASRSILRRYPELGRPGLSDQSATEMAAELLFRLTRAAIAAKRLYGAADGTTLCGPDEECALKDTSTGGGMQLAFRLIPENEVATRTLGRRPRPATISLTPDKAICGSSGAPCFVAKLTVSGTALLTERGIRRREAPAMAQRIALHDWGIDVIDIPAKAIASANCSWSTVVHAADSWRNEMAARREAQSPVAISLAEGAHPCLADPRRIELGSLDQSWWNVPGAKGKARIKDWVSYLGLPALVDVGHAEIVWQGGTVVLRGNLVAKNLEGSWAESLTLDLLHGHQAQWGQEVREAALRAVSRTLPILNKRIAGRAFHPGWLSVPQGLTFHALTLETSRPITFRLYAYPEGKPELLTRYRGHLDKAGQFNWVDPEAVLPSSAALAAEQVRKPIIEALAQIAIVPSDLEPIEVADLMAFRDLFEHTLIQALTPAAALRPDEREMSSDHSTTQARLGAMLQHYRLAADVHAQAAKQLANVAGSLRVPKQPGSETTYPLQEAIGDLQDGIIERVHQELATSRWTRVSQPQSDAERLAIELMGLAGDDGTKARQRILGALTASIEPAVEEFAASGGLAHCIFPADISADGEANEHSSEACRFPENFAATIRTRVEQEFILFSHLATPLTDKAEEKLRVATLATLYEKYDKPGPNLLSDQINEAAQRIRGEVGATALQEIEESWSRALTKRHIDQLRAELRGFTRALLDALRSQWTMLGIECYQDAVDQWSERTGKVDEACLVLLDETLVGLIQYEQADFQDPVTIETLQRSLERWLPGVLVSAESILQSTDAAKLIEGLSVEARRLATATSARAAAIQRESRDYFDRHADQVQTRAIRVIERALENAPIAVNEEGQLVFSRAVPSWRANLGDLLVGINCPALLSANCLDTKFVEVASVVEQLKRPKSPYIEIQRNGERFRIRVSTTTDFVLEIAPRVPGLQTPNIWTAVSVLNEQSLEKAVADQVMKTQALRNIKAEVGRIAAGVTWESLSQEARTQFAQSCRELFPQLRDECSSAIWVWSRVFNRDPVALVEELATKVAEAAAARIQTPPELRDPGDAMDNARAAASGRIRTIATDLRRLAADCGPGTLSMAEWIRQEVATACRSMQGQTDEISTALEAFSTDGNTLRLREANQKAAELSRLLVESFADALARRTENEVWARATKLAMESNLARLYELQPVFEEAKDAAEGLCLAVKEQAQSLLPAGDSGVADSSVCTDVSSLLQGENLKNLAKGELETIARQSIKEATAPIQREIERSHEGQKERFQEVVDSHREQLEQEAGRLVADVTGELKNQAQQYCAGIEKLRRDLEASTAASPIRLTSDSTCPPRSLDLKGELMMPSGNNVKILGGIRINVEKLEAFLYEDAKASEVIRVDWQRVRTEPSLETAIAAELKRLGEGLKMLSLAFQERGVEVSFRYMPAGFTFPVEFTSVLNEHGLNLRISAFTEQALAAACDMISEYVKQSRWEIFEGATVVDSSPTYCKRKKRPLQGLHVAVNVDFGDLLGVVPVNAYLDAKNGIRIEAPNMKAVSWAALLKQFGISGLTPIAPFYDSTDGLTLYFSGAVDTNLGLMLEAEFLVSPRRFAFRGPVGLQIPGWYDTSIISFGDLGLVYAPDEKEVTLKGAITVVPGAATSRLVKVTGQGSIKLGALVLEVRGSLRVFGILDLASARTKLDINERLLSHQMGAGPLLADIIKLSGSMDIQDKAPNPFLRAEADGDLFGADIAEMQVELNRRFGGSFRSRLEIPVDSSVDFLVDVEDHLSDIRAGAGTEVRLTPFKVKLDMLADTRSIEVGIKAEMKALPDLDITVILPSFRMLTAEYLLAFLTDARLAFEIPSALDLTAAMAPTGGGADDEGGSSSGSAQDEKKPEESASPNPSFDRTYRYVSVRYCDPVYFVFRISCKWKTRWDPAYMQGRRGEMAQLAGYTASQAARNHVLARTFDGTMPDYDLLAEGKSGKRVVAFLKNSEPVWSGKYQVELSELSAAAAAHSKRKGRALLVVAQANRYYAVADGMAIHSTTNEIVGAASVMQGSAREFGTKLLPSMGELIIWSETVPKLHSLGRDTKWQLVERTLKTAVDGGTIGYSIAHFNAQSRKPQGMVFIEAIAVDGSGAITTPDKVSAAFAATPDLANTLDTACAEVPYSAIDVPCAHAVAGGASRGDQSQPWALVLDTSAEKGASAFVSNGAKAWRTRALLPRGASSATLHDASPVAISGVMGAIAADADGLRTFVDLHTSAIELAGAVRVAIVGKREGKPDSDYLHFGGQDVRYQGNVYTSEQAEVNCINSFWRSDEGQWISPPQEVLDSKGLTADDARLEALVHWNRWRGLEFLAEPLGVVFGKCKEAS